MSVAYSEQVPGETKRLESFASELPPKSNILEIGFNGGHGACTMLYANRHAKVISFDIGHYYDDCGQFGYKYLQQHYPDRIKLILGSSRITVPEFSKANPEMKFDLIFIDGDHTRVGAKDDIMNCRSVSHNNTIVVVDDEGSPRGRIIEPASSVVPYTEWSKEMSGSGPMFAWVELLNKGIIEESGREIYEPGRGLVWGKYTF